MGAPYIFWILRLDLTYSKCFLSICYSPSNFASSDVLLNVNAVKLTNLFAEIKIF